MKEIITYQHCPACSSVAISKVLDCKDYTVSQQIFEVWKCSSCTLQFTQNVPSIDSIASYYKSAEYISHSNTQKGIINRLYHLVRNVTLSTKLSLVKKASGKDTGYLLDVGAGTGAFAHKMQNAGWSVIGLEPDETARTTALNSYGISLENLDRLPALTANVYDVITLWHVLEHVHDLHGSLKNFNMLLKADGVLIIAVPNYCSHDATVYENCWAAYDVPRHLYHFAPKSMEVLMDAHGFEVQQMKPMWFDSFYVSLLSEKYKGGNVFRGLWNGLVSNIKTLSDKKCCSSITYIIRKKPIQHRPVNP